MPHEQENSCHLMAAYAYLPRCGAPLRYFCRASFSSAAIATRVARKTHDAFHIIARMWQRKQATRRHSLIFVAR